MHWWALSGYGYIPDDTRLWTHIWRIALNGHGPDAQLQAVHLTSFMLPGSVSTTSYRSASLYSDRYARAFIQAGLGACVEIYDWTASNLQEHNKITINERCVSDVFDVLRMGLTFISGSFTPFEP